MNEPVAGKFLLEILTKGMYSNPMHIYREYIQNSTDSIDKAIATGVLSVSEAAIHIQIDEQKRQIIIRDNGLGISKEIVQTKLLDVGASDKDGFNERGFRGIGRLAGLAYAEEVRFVTSALGENTKTIMICDCVKLQQLLQKSSNETKDLMETFKAISTFENQDEGVSEHYFEVWMNGVPIESGLLEKADVFGYIAETAPVDFDSQQFVQARKIRKYFEDKGYPITCYKIIRGARKLPIYKKYSRVLNTGKQAKTKNKDFIRDVEFVYEESSDGQPLYIGWLAITDFSGVISDETVQGIRFRKGNILVGNGTTFSKYFPSEGHNANRMFAGEIHILHKDLIPNSQRDDFEPNEVYNELKRQLGLWAGTINKKYRRGTSEATSALRKLNELNVQQKELEEKVNSGVITSDEKREQIAEKLNKIAKSRETEEKKVRKALERGTFDKERRETVEKTLSQTKTATKGVASLNTKIINSGYATKDDLSSSYSRDERKLYQRIITVIDKFFGDDHGTAEKLREAIKSELSVKRK